VVGEVRRGLDHAPRVTRWAHPAPLAGEGDEEVVPALPTTGTGEAMGEDAAFQIAAELALDVDRHRIPSAHPSRWSASQVAK